MKLWKCRGGCEIKN